MGLVSSLNNAVSGLRINQDSLAVVSRNIANSGTPGYHRQSLNVIDHNDASSSYARSAGVQRAFNQSLQTYYTRQVSDAAQANVQARYLEQLGTYLGKPGAAGALDRVFQDLTNAIGLVATSPDDYTARAQAVAQAQSMAETLNRLSADIQGMRAQIEEQIAGSVRSLNSMLASLEEVNLRLLDLGMADGSRATLLDQRDRLVAGIAEKIDVRADYRADGTVALMTRSGVGLIDGRASRFGFESAGALSAGARFNADPALSGVGRITVTTPSGLTLDLVQQGIVQGGELGGLLGLRDQTLVEAQAQLDEIAAGLALAFGTRLTPGTPVPGGYEAYLGAMRAGNDLVVDYVQNGVSRQLRIVNTTGEMDYVDAGGVRVIGADLSGDPAAVAAALGARVPGLGFAAGTGATLRVLDGAAQVTGILARTTPGAAQGEGLGFSLFVDQGNQGFSNDIDRDPPQKLGFAGRISVNAALVADNRLLVQHEVGGTLGDSARPNHFLDQLGSMRFVSGGDPGAEPGRFRLGGTVGELISQTIAFQGGSIAASVSRRDDRLLTLETITRQMEVEYGVNIDEEMARLIELQNAYAANARVVSIVQELLAELFRI